MILSQPGAWSAEPSGLLSGPCTRGSKSPNLMPLALRVVGRSEYFASGSGEHFWRNLSAYSRQYSWMHRLQHPSLPRRSAQIDPRRIPEGPVAYGLSRTSRGGSYKRSQVSDPIMAQALDEFDNAVRVARRDGVTWATDATVGWCTTRAAPPYLGLGPGGARPETPSAILSPRLSPGRRSGATAHGAP